MKIEFSHIRMYIHISLTLKHTVFVIREIFEFRNAGLRVRFPDDLTIFPEESIHRTIFGLNVGLTRNDRSEQDLDSYYNEGTHGTRTDKRELGHR